MTRRLPRGWRWLAGLVSAHLAILIAHGHAHREASVSLSPGAALFVYLVIVAGPLVGLALAPRAPRIGALLAAGSLAGALSFGVVNHFVAAGSDNVAHVDARRRSLFTLTAVLLAVSEAAGATVALQLARERRSR